MATAIPFFQHRVDEAGRDKALGRRMQECRILVVDDEEPNVRVLRRIMARAGLTDVHTVTDSREAAARFEAVSPDLVLLDLRMPHLDGFAVLEQLRERIPSTTYLPILVLTGDGASEARQQALRLGARDFLTKPFEASEVVLRIQNLLEARLLHLSLARQNAQLEQKVGERTTQLEAALRAAESASRAKSEFLASMSHELRTPLNSVIGFTNVLLKNKAQNLLPQDLAYLQRIVSNGSHLLELINGILDLSKVEAGKMEIALGEVAIERVIYETLEQLEGRFVGTSVVPRVTMPPRLRAIESDEQKLKQVLINLIGNAVKFTEQGTISVVVHVDDADVPIRLDVVDTGIGIAPQRLASIFDSFEQGDASMRRRFGGTGLGLTISRALCRLLGYRLTVVSQLGVGSMFSILLDAGIPAPTAYPER